MEQHPIPQQISSYEFRLVGDMTLKQFAQVGGGALVAFVFYISPLPFYIKWPFILLFALTGAAVAFLPFEGRPLQTWVFAFFKSVYSPTQYTWQKRPQKPDFLEDLPVRAPQSPVQVIPGDQTKLNEYLETLPQTKDPLDQKEEEFLGRIKNLFSSPAVPRPAAAPFQTPQTAQMPPAPQPQPVAAPRQEAPFPQRISQEAQFAPEIPIPSVPQTPNTLVGMILDEEGKIVEGAIMEIRDSQGSPVRALKTNKLGQFRIVTPLPNDTYEIEVEKEGFDFDLVKILLRGEIVQPFEIRAKRGQN